MHDRREFLRTVPAAAVASVAGCLDALSEEEGTAFELARNEVTAEAAGGGTFPMHQYDPGHRGYVSGTATEDAGADRWVSTVDPPASPGAILGHGYALVVSGSTRVCALDRTDGALRWHFDALGSTLTAPAAGAAEDLTVFGSVGDDPAESSVFAMEGEEGGVRWETTDVGAAPTRPTVHDGTVYVGDREGSAVSAIGLRNGEVDWQTPLDGAGGQVAADDDGVFLRAGSSLYRLDPLDGTLRWERVVEADGRDAPTLAGEAVIAANGPSSVAAWEADDGDHRWTVDDPAGPRTAACVVDGTVYLAGAALTAVDLADGTVRWRRSIVDLAAAVESIEGDLDAFGTAIATDDTVYAGLGRGLLAVDRETGDHRWHRSFRNRTLDDTAAGGTPGSFAVGEDAVYAYTTGGDLYCIAR